MKVGIKVYLFFGVLLIFLLSILESASKNTIVNNFLFSIHSLFTMKNTLSFLVPTFLSLAFGVFGQTSTSCNPLNTSKNISHICVELPTNILIACPEDSALGKTITVDFTQGESSEFTIADGTTITYGDNGAEFTITSAGLARTITSKNYIFFGKVDITMKAAPGQGIVSSLVMESDDLDEIDLVGIPTPRQNLGNI